MGLIETSSAELASYTNLIIVCGHATYLGDGANTTEDQWLLQPFQRSEPVAGKRGEHETFLAHIAAAAMLTQHDPRALIVLSGGHTASVQRSEAAGYAALLTHMTQANPALFPRPVTFALEPRATDSYQNLLFALLRFRHLTGAYPAEVCVVTHAFKAPRFLEQHAPAIRWPTRRLRVHGIDPPFSRAERDAVCEGERARAYVLFAEDPYGVRAPLVDKRAARGWHAETVNMVVASGLGAEVAGLLEWTGGVSGREIYPRRLPWEG